MKLNLYVCENFAPDYEDAIRSENFEDVAVVKFPCLCSKRNMVIKALELIEGEDQSEIDKFILCGDNCKIIKRDNITGLTYKIKTSTYCFNYLANEKLIEYILEKGGYAVTNGWLKNWHNRLAQEGFDRVTAQKFYG